MASKICFHYSPFCFNFVLAFVTCTLTSPLFGHAQSKKNLSEKQCRMLVDAAWYEVPQSMDITLTKRLAIKEKRSEEQQRAHLLRTYSQMAKLQDSTSGQYPLIDPEDLTNRTMARRRLYQGGRVNKVRIRVQGPHFRADLRKIKPDPHQLYADYDGKSLVPEGVEYLQTFVNCGDPLKGDFTHHSLDWINRSAELNDSPSSRWRQTDMTGWVTIGPVARSILRSMLGDLETLEDGSQRCTPNGVKIKLLQTGNHPQLRIQVSETRTKDGIRCDELTLRDRRNRPLCRLLLKATNYRHCFEIESLAAPLGISTVLLKREQSRFHVESGYPQQWHEWHYNPIGQVTREEECVVTALSLNPKIPSDVFAFNPPRGFNVLEHIGETTRSIRDGKVVWERPRIRSLDGVTVNPHANVWNVLRTFVIGLSLGLIVVWLVKSLKRNRTDEN